MKKTLAVIGCVAALLSACDNKKEQNNTADTVDNTVVSSENTVEIPRKISAVWDEVANDAEKFDTMFSSLSEAEKYYFCTAFTMGAMSVAKPTTASAMVGYFLGLGVAKYGQGIDEQTYKAFDLGKTSFLYENVVNSILENKTCENIMVEATEYANANNLTTEDLNERGKYEAERIVEHIQQ